MKELDFNEKPHSLTEMVFLFVLRLFLSVSLCFSLCFWLYFFALAFCETMKKHLKRNRIFKLLNCLIFRADAVASNRK